MSARPDTWMPMYWGDYGRDTGHLNARGHGAYLMLIKHYWCTGQPLADDDDELWRIACCDSKKEWLEVRPRIARMFIAGAGVLRHKRVDRELAMAVSRSKAKAEAGRQGSDKRWGAKGKAIADPSVCHPEAIADPSGCHWQTDTQSQSQSPSPKNTPRTPPQPVKRRVAASPTDEPGFLPPDDPAPEPAPRRGARIPPDWQPCETDAAYARQHGVDPALAAEEFRNYWIAVAGKAGVKLDWAATWRNRVLELQSRGKFPCAVPAALKPRLELKYPDRPPGFDNPPKNPPYWNIL